MIALLTLKIICTCTMAAAFAVNLERAFHDKAYAHREVALVASLILAATMMLIWR